MIKRTSFAAALLVISFVVAVVVTPSVSAYDVTGTFCDEAPDPKPAICYADKPTENPIVGADGLLTTVVGFFALITGIISVIVIILMGFRYVTANGDANKAASARQGIIYAIAGLIVALLAQAIVMFVLNKLE